MLNELNGGLTFHEGRDKVCAALDIAINTLNENKTIQVKNISLFSIVPCSIALAFILIGYFENYTGVIITGVIIMFITIANVVILIRTSYHQQNEFKSQLVAIYEKYKIFTINKDECLDVEDDNSSSSISSGHPHISIVTCYR